MGKEAREKMRDYKFRGWSTWNDEWIYGSLIKKNFAMDNAIGVNGFDPVAEESIGEYTGCQTGDGTEIYEGDILQESGDLETRYYTVRWDENEAMWCADDEDGYTHPLCDLPIKSCMVTVIGNLWERKMERRRKDDGYGRIG